MDNNLPEKQPENLHPLKNNTSNTRFLFIPFTVVFLVIILSDYFAIFINFNDLADKYPIKFFVIYWALHLFRLVYCISYIGILLLGFNKILLKLNNLFKFSILFFLTIIFFGIMVSDWPDRYLGYDNVFDHQIFGKFFWYFEWHEWDWIRLSYSIFYAVFLLLILNIKILKLSNKMIFSIISLAGISNIIWIIEVLLRGWRGLYWLEYIHIAPFIIGILFFCWLIIINKMYKTKKHAVDILFYGILYVLFLLVFIKLFNLLFSHVYARYGLRYSFSKYWKHYILIIMLQMCIIFIINSVIARYEKVVMCKKIICLNLFSMVIIPIYTFLSSFIILNSNISNMIGELTFLSGLTFFGINASYFDPVDWLKLGSIIFGLIIYECLYIAYLKQNKLPAITSTTTARIPSEN